MKARAVLVVAAALLLMAAAPKEDKESKGLKDIQGTWDLSSLTTDGKEVPPADLKEFKAVIKGNKYTLMAGNQTLEEGTLETDDSKNPKTVDSVADTGPNKGKKQQGIYKVDGDQLTMCFAATGKDERPTDFTSKAGSLYELSVYKREKP